MADEAYVDGHRHHTECRGNGVFTYTLYLNEAIPLPLSLRLDVLCQSNKTINSHIQATYTRILKRIDKCFKTCCKLSSCRA